MRLFTTYSVVVNDTFAKISRKVYGTEIRASQIARSNPGAIEPLNAGTLLTIPDIPGAPKLLTANNTNTDEDEVTITIDRVRFRFWESVQITRSIDSPDTVSFDAPFEPDLPNFRETFRPFSFKEIRVTVGDIVVFTGTLLLTPPLLEPDRRLVNISGYSRPGVLADCTSPASSLEQLEFNDQGLQQIAGTLAAPFGVSVVFDANQGDIFERVAINPAQKISDFLITLAKQRNLIMSNTTEGELLFLTSVSLGTPVARLTQGNAPLVEVEAFFSPQDYYSHVTAISSVQVGDDGGKFTVKNPFFNTSLRSLTFNAPDSEGSSKVAAEAKLGRMFGNATAYTVTVATWRDSRGALWEPNTTITVTAPGAMIYTEYEFIVREVSFEVTSTARTATLGLVLPGSFSGEVPRTLPWD